MRAGVFAFLYVYEQKMCHKSSLTILFVLEGSWCGACSSLSGVFMTTGVRLFANSFFSSFCKQSCSFQYFFFAASVYCLFGALLMCLLIVWDTARLCSRYLFDACVLLLTFRSTFPDTIWTQTSTSLPLLSSTWTSLIFSCTSWGCCAVRHFAIVMFSFTNHVFVEMSNWFNA